MQDEPLGARSMAVWTRSDALRHHSRHVLQRLLDEGTWQVVYPGVYADGGYVLSAEQEAFAAVLAVTRRRAPSKGDPQPGPPLALACGRDAARVWGLPLIDDDDPATGAREHLLHDVHTAVGLTRRHGPGDPDARRTLTPHRLDLSHDDYVRRDSGLWVATPLRTAWDCTALLTKEALICLLDDGLRRALFSVTDLEAEVARHPRAPRSRAFRDAVALADGRAEAPSETLARLLLLPVIPSLVPQVRLLDGSARIVARFDLGDEEVRFAVEMDGRRGHAGEQMVAKDRRRDRSTSGYGWWTERGTWYDVRRRQSEFVARMAAEHSARSRRAA